MGDSDQAMHAEASIASGKIFRSLITFEIL